MATRPIVLYPDPVLLRPAKTVEQVDDDVRELVEDMIETMHAAPGIGLAANQVGVALRICVVDLSAGEEPDGVLVFINPEIVETEGWEVGEEGCLSFPDIALDVERYREITVRALDTDGQPFTLEADDLLARVIQHECEHLDGAVFLRNVSSLRRELLKKQIRKRIQAGLDRHRGFMKIVFLGTPRVAVASLEAVCAAGLDVALVISQPDRPVGRSRHPVPTPVKQAAQAHGIEVFQPLKVRNKGFRNRLELARPDALVVVAYGRILPSKVLGLAPLGAINAHFSLLPLYRGAAPVQWALARGERSTGVTTMLMNEKMDEGDILLQRSVVIEEREHTPALQERLAGVASEMVVETLTGLTAGKIRPTPQDHAAATLAPLLRREDGELSPSLTAREIEGRVRGFDPWPGGWMRLAGRRIRLVDAVAEPGREATAAPGVVTGLSSSGLSMACGGATTLLLTRLQPEGRRVVTARDAVNGRIVRVGDRFEQAPG